MVTNQFEQAMHAPHASASLTNQQLLDSVQKIAAINPNLAANAHLQSTGEVGASSQGKIKGSSNAASPKDWTLEQLG
jgi:hypothetical protein